MNEQLVVKNFGPIKDATVDFKRVTVFIGPTGGGKSTLAKLAAIYRDTELFHLDELLFFKKYSLEKFTNPGFSIDWITRELTMNITKDGPKIDDNTAEVIKDKTHELVDDIMFKLESINTNSLINKTNISSKMKYILIDNIERIKDNLLSNTISTIIEEVYISSKSVYFPSDRNFVSAAEYSWAGLMRDDIGLPKTILDFANNFSLSRKNVSDLNIPFLNVKYLHRNGQDFIKIPESETPFRLYETASGIQSVTPLLVLLEHLSRNTEQAQSFIIEEPELNLYPTAQQGLLNWLVGKCTKGENDLTITTHSPYILSHLNLLLYAYQVAQQHPDRAEEVDKIVPRESWINPVEFACYQVEGGGVSSLVNVELGLIDNNELDGLSGDAADAFDNLIRLSKGIAVK